MPMNNMNMMIMGLQPTKVLGWTDQMCADISMAVDAEAKRTKIAAQFLPRFEIAMGEMGMSDVGMGMNHVCMLRAGRYNKTRWPPKRLRGCQSKRPTNSQSLKFGQNFR